MRMPKTSPLARKQESARAGKPIVWHRDKWMWRDRNLPQKLCRYQADYGEVAFRRIRQPGWIYEQQILNRFFRRYDT